MKAKIHNENSCSSINRVLGPLSETNDNNNILKKKKKKRRRWEIPLTSRPFQGVEDLQSTIIRCTIAITIYFIIGSLVFPLWLQPSWSLIDGLYFSMASITTVGYGDVISQWYWN